MWTRLLPRPLRPALSQASQAVALIWSGGNKKRPPAPGVLRPNTKAENTTLDRFLSGVPRQSPSEWRGSEAPHVHRALEPATRRLHERGLIFAGNWSQRIDNLSWVA